MSNGQQLNNCFFLLSYKSVNTDTITCAEFSADSQYDCVKKVCVFFLLLKWSAPILDAQVNAIKFAYFNHQTKRNKWRIEKKNFNESLIWTRRFFARLLLCLIALVQASKKNPNNHNKILFGEKSNNIEHGCHAKRIRERERWRDRNRMR